MLSNSKAHSVLFILLVAMLTGCNLLPMNKKDQAVAECYGEFLYKDELSGLVPDGTNPNDSIAITKQYIDNWIMQQVMLRQAEMNLTENQKNFKDQIESYRNSLIIYAYESELIRQKLDTIISDAEIAAFYYNNQQNFQLRENIVKVKYVKVPKIKDNQQVVKKATHYIKSEKDEDIEELIKLCNDNALQCYIDDNGWIRFDDLLNEVPIKTDDPERFLEGRKFYEMEDSSFVYLINFLDSKTKEGTSPLSFEVENIRNLLLNRRKIELMDHMQREVFQKAMENKDFTIY